MLFSSLIFLFGFLPLCLFLYFIIPKKYIKLKNLVLLIFSVIFYAWGEPKYIILMFLTVLMSYLFGLLINYFDINKSYKKKKITFIVSIIAILSSLIYFKYTNFIIDNVNNILKTNITFKEIILPIGISFYTFQILSYIIDLYRHKITVQKNFFNLFLYISFFPQLIAGPIVKYETIEEELTKRTTSFDKVITGLERFIIGLNKKVLIANQMAIIADTIFNSASIQEYSSLVLIIGILAYTFQIYFDFSGYSDMAIGLGKIFGFDFLENFDYPYISFSITEFWKKWHISLTTFFREYLYIPLGGNRVSKLKWIRNMFIVWLLTGLWHGAAWTFIIWGIYYFIILMIEKSILNTHLKKIPKFFQFIYTFILINLGWLIFRANSLSDIGLILNNIFTNKGSISLIDFLNGNSKIVFALPFMILAIVCSTNIYIKLNNKYKNNWIFNGLKKCYLLGIFLISIAFLTSSLYNPFIYFRF